MTEPVVHIQDLSFSYDGKVPILENITLSFLKGEFIGIFGPNGGGKTTFLKLIMGFLKPTGGTIELGTDKRRIGYVPQVARFDKQFPISVLDVVLMGCLSEAYWWGGLPRGAKEKARGALEKVNLLSKENQPFGTLSGGQAQRALIARALVNDPELLLLDEPTASVDPGAENEIYQLLLKLKGSMTILMVTHDLQAIVDKAGKLICIQRKATSLFPSEVCEHFALGLYHTPLIKPKI